MTKRRFQTMGILLFFSLAFAAFETDASAADPEKVALNEDVLNDALKSLPEMMSKARAVPYFRNGQVIGVRLFAVRAGSIYEEMGLKNGDVILAVNDRPVTTSAEALTVAEPLNKDRALSIKLERGSETLLKQYTLTKDKASKTKTPETAPASKKTVTVSRKELSDALSDEGYFQSLARAVPYYRSGEVVGIRVFAILPESVFEKAGLKSGDILLAAGEDKLHDPAQLRQIFERLEKEKTLRLRIERNSEVLELDESTK